MGGFFVAKFAKLPIDTYYHVCYTCMQGSKQTTSEKERTMRTGTHTIKMIGTQANTMNNDVINWYIERFEHADGFMEKRYYYKYFACGMWFESDKFEEIPKSVKLNQ